MTIKVGKNFAVESGPIMIGGICLRWKGLPKVSTDKNTSPVRDSGVNMKTPVLAKLQYRVQNGEYMTTDDVLNAIEDAFDDDAWQMDENSTPAHVYLGMTKGQYHTYVMEPEQFAEDVLNGLI